MCVGCVLIWHATTRYMFASVQPSDFFLVCTSDISILELEISSNFPSLSSTTLLNILQNAEQKRKRMKQQSKQANSSTRFFFISLNCFLFFVIHNQNLHRSGNWKFFNKTNLKSCVKKYVLSFLDLFSPNLMEVASTAHLNFVATLPLAVHGSLVYVFCWSTRDSLESSVDLVAADYNEKCSHVRTKNVNVIDTRILTFQVLYFSATATLVHRQPLFVFPGQVSRFCRTSRVLSQAWMQTLRAIDDDTAFSVATCWNVAIW